MDDGDALDEDRASEVGTADVGQNKVVGLGQEMLLLSQGIEDHEVEEDADEGAGHVRGHHHHAVHHPL